MAGVGPCGSCGNKNGVWRDQSKQYLCASHWKLAKQFDAAIQGKEGYCLKCLDLPEEDVRKLTDAGGGLCPHCGGTGPLFWYD
jgi:hypothetical protein